MIGDHTFEAFDIKEVMEFKRIINPDYWERGIRKDIETLKTVYILSWTIVDKEKCDEALKRWEEHKKEQATMENIQKNIKDGIDILLAKMSICCVSLESANCKAEAEVMMKAYNVIQELCKTVDKYEEGMNIIEKRLSELEIEVISERG